MSNQSQGRISLDHAKQLVALLEAEQHQQAESLLRDMSLAANSELFSEVGKLTRELHDAMTEFQQDPRLATLATQEIPDATERLNHVITMTEQAANQTMDAVEACLPMADRLLDTVGALQPSWQRLMEKELQLGEFRQLCYDLDAFIKASEADANELRNKLNEVLMAQGFQDLTGQIIRRVIELVREVEEKLVGLLTAFGAPEAQEHQQQSGIKAEGPILDAEKRDDVVSNQDEVDDLLSSLGF
ncbi:protein phosphatase CheZ [Gallaecimonas sp. GXIMD4217]|uniref:protein phosphatase CheZ n=1 Tax=Gallaecimonas sp. GXIMD4217 TaxID=3131927 RepID=UPI00311AE31E